MMMRNLMRVLIVGKNISALIVLMVLCSFNSLAGVPHAAFDAGRSVNLAEAQQYFTTDETNKPSTSVRTAHITNSDLDNLLALTAKGLNYDPERIYEFVRNNVNLHPVFGESKGAYGALIDFEGTAFDQSRLAMLLLHESDGKHNQSISAKIHIGKVTLTPSQLSSWLGVYDKKMACRYFANGGIPSSLANCGVLSGNVTSNVDIAHAWIDVTINGQVERWDLAFKEMDYLPKLGNLRSTARNNSEVPAQKLLIGAEKNFDGLVPYIRGINKNGLMNDLTDASIGLDAFLKSNDNYSRQLDDVVGGHKIVRYKNGMSKAPLSNYTTWSAGGYQDIPDIYRIILDLDVWSVGYPANPDYSGHTAENLISSILSADEVYGRLFRIKARTNCNDGMSGDDIHITGSYCLMLSVGDTNVVEVMRDTMFMIPSAFGKEVPSLKKNIDITIAYNHPYANSYSSSQTNAGDFQDGHIIKRASVLSDTIIVNGWGATSADLIAMWNKRLGRDGKPPSFGHPCGISDPEVTRDYSCLKPRRASNIVRHKLAASYLSQSSLFYDMLASLSTTNIIHHRTIGFVYGTHVVKDMNQAQPTGGVGTPVAATNAPYFTSADDSIYFDIRPSWNVISDTNNSNIETSVKRSLAVISSALEGLVFKHVLGSYDVVTTGSKFAWASSGPPRDTDGPARKLFNGDFVDDSDAPFPYTIPKFYLFNPSNYSIEVAGNLLTEENYLRLPGGVFLGLPHPKLLSIFQLDKYIASGYSVVMPSETFLGPGPVKGTTLGIYTRVSCLNYGAVGGGGCATTRTQVHNPHPSRGSAMVAWNSDTSKIGHAIVRRFGVVKGGGASFAPGEIAQPKPPKADTFIDPSDKLKLAYGVDTKSGSFSYSTPEMVVGEGTGRNSLSISYSFNSGYKDPNDIQWKNTLRIKGNLSSSGLETLAVSRAVNGSPSIVTIEALLENYIMPTTNSYDIIAREIAGPLIMDWWGRTTENNVFTLQKGSSALVFVKNSAGDYNAPLDQPGLILNQTGSPVMIEAIPLLPPNAENRIPLKSTYTRKWDYNGMNFSLENNPLQVTYSFKILKTIPYSMFEDLTPGPIDPLDQITSWYVNTISSPVDRDITYSAIAGTSPLSNTLDSVEGRGGTRVSNGSRYIDYNTFFGIEGKGSDGRIITSYPDFSTLPNTFINEQGHTVSLNYSLGGKVQEGVSFPVPTIGQQLGNGASIFPSYLYEYPFVGIKEIYEPGQVPGTDVPMATIEYNVLGQVSRITDKDGISTSYGYARGRMSSVIDALGNETISKYDEDGHLIELIEPSYEGAGQ